MTLSLFQKNVSLASYCSWRVGGPAEFFSEPATLDELASAVHTAKTYQLPITVLGGGTNVLISDQGIKGLVISLAKLSRMEHAEVNGDVFQIAALSGTPKSHLLKAFLTRKLAPAKFLAGLPGQVGGGVVMNAGVSEKLIPREFCEMVSSVDVMRDDGSIERISKADLSWSYRSSDGWQPGIIVRVVFEWPNEPDATVLDEVKKLNKNRLSKQPLEWPSCGSVFVNPLPEHAGALIERAGLKGRMIGDAQISDKHANFIINRGQAKAQDILACIRLCQSEVHRQFGIHLQSEVVMLGFDQ